MVLGYEIQKFPDLPHRVGYLGFPYWDGFGSFDGSALVPLESLQR